MLKRTGEWDAASETKPRKKTQNNLLRRSRKTHTEQLEKSNLNPPHSRRRSTECNPERLQQQKMEVVGQLATGIAHDIKNLLTVISGNLEMLAHDRAKEMQERRILVAEATRVTDLMAQLAANLLAFARKERVDREVTDVGHLAASTARFLTRIIGNGIGLQIQAETALSAKINPAQFQTALINLVLNARDAMPGGGCVSIRVEETLVEPETARDKHLKPGRYVMVSVVDDGRGMPTESLERAFELFYTTKPAGTGLGLATVEEFAANVGGSARIKSELDRGTTVELLIPLHAEDPTVTGGSPSLAP